MTEAGAAPDAGRGTRSDWRIYRRLLGYVRPHWPLFAVAVLGFALANGAEAYFARLFGDIVEAFDRPTPSDWLQFPLLMLAAVAARGVGEFLGEYALARVSYRVVHALRCQLFDQLLALPSSYFDRSARGHVVSRITFNVAQLRDTATDALKSVVQDGSKVVILLGAMAWANLRLTLVFMLVAPVVAAVVGYTSRKFRRISRRIQDSMGDVTHVASETVNGHRVVRTFAGEDYERERFNRASEANQRRNLRLVATKAWSTHLIQVFVAVGLAILVGLLFHPQISAGMSAGDVVYFVGLAGLLARPIKKLSEVNPRLQRGLAAAEDIFAQLDERTESDTGTVVIERARGRIEFRNVSFDYAIGAGAVLHDVSFTIEPGQRVAVVGRSGSGKSTLASLIPRFYEATRGEILLDGVPISEYRLRSLRNQIAFVDQNVVLFNDTLARNVAYGALAGADPQAVADAIRRAHAESFVAALPQGVDTVVGDDGVLLSGGQRQRVAIARALLKDAPILVLDEATSALDPESEKHVQSALEEVMRGRTTVVIAHRLSTIENADVIFVMDGGRIVESGRHAELLARRGLYASLYEARFDDAATAPAPPVPAPDAAVPVVDVGHDRFPESGWYGNRVWTRLLAPAAAIYAAHMRRRRLRHLAGRADSWRAPVPLIVVGNLTVGGTGKTPLVEWLVRFLRENGFRPGIVARGYGGRGPYPAVVDEATTTAHAGDEAVMLARRTGVPVVVDPERARAVRELLARNVCDVVVADDGLQHYALARDLEIVVLDGARGVGNGRCLPAGPLREPLARMAEADWIVATGRATGLDSREHVVTQRATAFVSLRTGERRPPTAFTQVAAHAVAGIGHPARFFRTLATLGVLADCHPLADHHRYRPADVHFDDDAPVLVTEKDAVKLKELDAEALPQQLWYLEVETVVPQAAVHALRDALHRHGIAPSRATAAPCERAALQRKGAS